MEKLKKGPKRKLAGVRKDAQNNRRVLILAALHLFKTQGPGISLTDVAKEAQMSRMTCYRNFPDKQALISAVFSYNLDQLALYATSLKNEEDAFFKLLDAVVDQHIDYNLLLPYMEATQSTQASAQVIATFKDAIVQAKKAKQLRKDFTGNDLILLLLMMGGAISHYALTQDKQQTKRALLLLLEGIKLK